MRIRRKKKKTSNDISFDIQIRHRYQKIPLEELLKKAIEIELSEFEDEDEDKEQVEFFYTGFTENTLNYKCRIKIDEKVASNKKQIKQMAKHKVEEIFSENNQKLPTIAGLIVNH